METLMNEYALVIPIRVDLSAELDRHFSLLGGQTLIERKFDQVSEMCDVAAIYVATSNPIVRSQAEERDFELIARPAVAEGASPGPSIGFHLTQLIKHIAQNVRESHIVWASATNPFFAASEYMESMRSYEGALSAGFDSLISVTETKAYLRDNSGAVNYEPGIRHAPLRSLDPLVFATTCVRVAAVDRMREWGYFHGPNPFEATFGRRASLEIRDELDLLTARAWIDVSEALH